MFKKILIANRGEIACRVIKTARKMGIKTVAVYSDADANGLHVEMADEAVYLGPPPAAESYLLMDKIIQACKDTGAEAVHPGFGFLSENAEFCKALEAANIVFIGPGVRAIGAMGDKIESKKLAEEAGVSTVPGNPGVIKDADEAVKISKEIGYPVMLKASAGGGGKGMRVAWNDAEAHEGFQSAVNEAVSSFGDDRVFIEKFVTDPRHIEIQVLGDKHGNVIHLNERECSIQRRHQKVIEEAPSPFLDQETRDAMGAEAIALAQAVDYCSAGTVEFIVDGDRNFYFLEMNTRLQVEHPVTELITGVDLVEQMIRVAYGEKLAIKQSDIGIKGWAMESRIYAEDPFRNFLPSIGRLTRYRPPAEGTNSAGRTIRNDTGVFEGAEISMFYDPMIAKLCTHGATRKDAIEHMEQALDEFYIRGIGHNVPFLAAVMGHERFRSGNITTGFIAEEYPDGFEGAVLTETDKEKLAALATFVALKNRTRDRLISGRLSDTPLPLGEDFVVALDHEDKIPVSVENAAGALEVRIDTTGNLYRVQSEWVLGHGRFRGTVNGATLTAQVDRTAAGFAISHGGATVEARVRTKRAAELADLMPFKAPPDTSKLLLCPMPGLIVSVDVEVGEKVHAGQTLAVVEAMKMENVLRAEKDGVVSTINAGPGDSLAVDEIILEFE